MAVNDPRIGSELAGYRIEALIGRGGMGVVYRAEDLRLGRKVALKLLAPELTENAGFRARFENESRLAAAIDHPHIIPLYEAGDAAGLLFLIMRYVDGIDLKALLERDGPLSLERALKIVAQVGGALDAAHARGLVHRDVKPANVLVASTAGAETSEHCYLTDFGLTKDTSQNKRVTGTGQFVGTIAYVAPEQIEGLAQGGATDQYALGCVLHELLTGHPPFERATELDVMWAHLSDDPPSVTALRPQLPPGLDPVLARALAKDPADRHASCAAMLAAARAAIATPPAAGRTVVAPTPARGDATRLTPRPAPPPPAAAPASALATTTTPAAEREPSAERVPSAEREPSGRRTGLIAVAVAVAVAAAVAGTVAGGSGEPVAPEAANVAAAGGLSLRFPADWETVSSPPAIAGLRLTDRISLRPRASGRREGLLAGRIASSDRRLLPADLVSGNAERVAARDVVRLGEADAFRYVGLRPAGFAGAVTVYLLLTERGRVAIACYTQSRAAGFDLRCANLAASLELTDVRAFALTPSPRYAEAMNDALADVARARAAGRRRLEAARMAVAQARATAALATAYAVAARRVSNLSVPAAARDANTAIAAALSRTGRAYATAAGAARGGDAARYLSAGRDIRRGEGSLRAAVRALAELGYAVQ